REEIMSTFSRTQHARLPDEPQFANQMPGILGCTSAVLTSKCPPFWAPIALVLSIDATSCQPCWRSGGLRLNAAERPYSAALRAGLGRRGHGIRAGAQS